MATISITRILPTVPTTTTIISKVAPVMDGVCDRPTLLTSDIAYSLVTFGGHIATLTRHHLHDYSIKY